MSFRTNSMARSEIHCADRSPISDALVVPCRKSLRKGGRQCGLELSAVTIVTTEVPPAFRYDSAAKFLLGHYQLSICRCRSSSLLPGYFRKHTRCDGSRGESTFGNEVTVALSL